VTREGLILGLLFLPSLAFSIPADSEEVRAEILVKIQAVVESAGNIESMRSREEGLRQIYEANPTDSNLKEWERFYRYLQEEERAFETEFAGLIDDTAKSYGIEIDKSVRKMKGGPFAGAEMKWQPVLVQRLNEYWMGEDPKGKPHAMTFTCGEGFLGVTTSDGRVGICQYALEKALELGDPGLLAVGIHHEHFHHKQLAEKTLESLEEAERDAWKATVEAVESFFHPTEDNKKPLGDMVKDFKKKYRYLRTRVWFGSLPRLRGKLLLPARRTLA